MQRHRCLGLALSVVAALGLLCVAASPARPAEPEAKAAPAIEKSEGATPAQPAAAESGAAGHEGDHGDPAHSAGAAGGPPGPGSSILAEFWYNFRHNLFKPLLLFFYMGFLFPILKVKFDFPYVIYQ